MYCRPIGIAALVLSAACSSSTDSGTGGGTPGPDQVFMQGSAFTPSTRTVATGTTVTWVNKDGLVHNVTSSSGPASFSSGSLGANATFSQNLAAAGTYQYYCTFHGTPTTGMRATVVVQ